MAISKEKIEIFIKEYLETDNATGAYRLTYPYKAKKWKPATLNNAAYKLLNNKKVKERLAEVRKELEDQLYFGVRAAFKKYEKIYQMGITPQGEHNNLNLAAAKGAIDSQARLFGLLVDKTIVRVDVRDEFEDKLKKEMSNEEK